MFRADRDLLVDQDGKTVLSERGVQRYRRARTTLLVALWTLSVGFLGLLWVRVDMDRLAGAEAVHLLQIRLDADRDARTRVAQDREEILVSALKTVVADKTNDPANQNVRVTNLQRLFADQRQTVQVAQANREILGDFHALTVLQVGAKLVPVNNTADGAYRPAVVAEYLRSTPAISGVLHAAVALALAKAPRDPRAIVRADLAKLLAERAAEKQQQFSPSTPLPQEQK